MTEQELYMQRCLQLAAMGAGQVAPNPLVGAVLVYQGRVIGEGYHQQYGGPHAEVNCIASVLPSEQELISQSTLYVSLEPCNHFGKTPPCTELIIRHRIPEVVIGCRDSFEKVDGSGIRQLQAQGIRVTEGILGDQALDLNRRFFTFHKKQRPYIILKWAQTANGKLSGRDGQRIAISNAHTNRLVHQWRGEEAAILVGTETARKDDPMLTTRDWPGKNPVRIVIDRHLRLPSHLKLFDRSTPTIVINTLKHEEGENLHYYQTSESDNLLGVLLHLLYQRQLTSLIVEGGAQLLSSFIRAGLWDEARVITNTIMNIPEGIAAPKLTHAHLLSGLVLGTDQIEVYRNMEG